MSDNFASALGVRVLDLTEDRGLYAGRMLADLGADVIKIEKPEGSRARRTGPFKNDMPGLENSLYFLNSNTNKRGITLNIDSSPGQYIFKELAKRIDVVIEDAEVVSMPSLGKGPHEQWTTWGMNLLSFTGFAYSWGHPDTPTEERSASNYYGDYTAAMKTATAIMAALHHRVRMGEGQYIEVSQTEATASLLGLLYLDYFVNNRVAQPRGNRHPQFAPYNCYRCKGDDRWCVIAVFNEDDWQKFCSALGFPELTQNSKFQNMETRLKNVEELDENIETWTRQRTPHQVMKIQQSAGIAAGAVQNNEDLYYDIQLRAGGHMVELDTGQNGILTFDEPPLHLSAGQKPRTELAPKLGEHNDYVYRQLLGLTPAEIEQLTANQVIF